MKTIINLILVMAFVFTATAQEKPVKIVFDVTSGNTDVHGSTMRHVKFMSQAYPESKFEVVLYSGSYEMVLKGKSTVAADLEILAKNKNISFVICQATMKRHNIKSDDLIPGVTSVPDGIMEIITKQAEGWGYIKEAQ
jgi:intracellular sulfur oxidation DsrE/DsrF family protein